MFSLIAFDYDILPTDVGAIYFDIRSNVDFRRCLAWQQREEGDDEIVQVPLRLKQPSCYTMTSRMNH